MALGSNRDRLVIGRFGSLFAFERALEALKRVEGVSIKAPDTQTIIILLEKKDEETKRRVEEIITTSKGHVEDLKWLEKHIEKRRKKGELKEGLSPLDYPVYG
jgi:hypothetical protein